MASTLFIGMKPRSENGQQLELDSDDENALIEMFFNIALDIWRASAKANAAVTKENFQSSQPWADKVAICFATYLEIKLKNGECRSFFEWYIEEIEMDEDYVEHMLEVTEEYILFLSDCGGTWGNR